MIKEVKVSALGGQCTSRNGHPEVGAVGLELFDPGNGAIPVARIVFYSRKDVALHAGGHIHARDMDALAKAWLEMRGQG